MNMLLHQMPRGKTLFLTPGRVHFSLAWPGGSLTLRNTQGDPTLFPQNRFGEYVYPSYSQCTILFNPAILHPPECLSTIISMHRIVCPRYCSSTIVFMHYFFPAPYCLTPVLSIHHSVHPSHSTRTLRRASERGPDWHPAICGGGHRRL
jgi:hypothetical protein